MGEREVVAACCTMLLLGTHSAGPDLELKRASRGPGSAVDGGWTGGWAAGPGKEAATGSGPGPGPPKGGHALSGCNSK